MLSGDWRHTVGLAWADLWYEWVLSLCMVLALGAVFSPVFILLGLREGIIGTMLERLDRDPLSRLVMPKYALQAPLEAGFLAALKGQTEELIQSPVPSLLLEINGAKEPVTVIPTSATDPLLSRHGLTPPADGLWVVLSLRLAADIGKAPGDTLQVMLKRSSPQEERVPVVLQVAGILPATVSTDAKLWLPEPVFRWFNNWRRGLPIPALGLAGAGLGLAPEFDGILTLLDRVPSELHYREMLAGRSGFSQMPQPIDELGWDLPQDREVRLWSPLNSRIFEDDLVRLRDRHLERGYVTEVLPYLEGFDVRLSTDGQPSTFRLVVLPDTSEALADPPGLGPEPPLVWVAPTHDLAAADTATLSFIAAGGHEVQFPVRLATAKALHPGYVAAPRALAGILNAARRQAAIFDPSTGRFLPAVEGDRYFRAYAPTIDAVEGLATWLRGQGDVSGDANLRELVSREAEVRQVRTLSQYMQTLYTLIVVVTGVSGIFAIAANVYAGVQRKRRDLAYLQLLGLGRGTLLLIATLKSLALVVGGLTVALGAYGVFAYLSGTLFSGLGTTSGALTRLGAQDTLRLVVGILFAATLASLLAASTITRIDPAEYLRE